MWPGRTNFPLCAVPADLAPTRAVAVGRRYGPLAEEVNVDVPGGRMIVRWPGPGEPIWLTGPAETAFEGQVEVTGAESPESCR